MASGPVKQPVTEASGLIDRLIDATLFKDERAPTPITLLLYCARWSLPCRRTWSTAEECDRVGGMTCKT